MYSSEATAARLRGKLGRIYCHAPQPVKACREGKDRPGSLSPPSLPLLAPDQKSWAFCMMHSVVSRHCTTTRSHRAASDWGRIAALRRGGGPEGGGREVEEQSCGKAWGGGGALQGGRRRDRGGGRGAPSSPPIHSPSPHRCAKRKVQGSDHEMKTNHHEVQKIFMRHPTAAQSWLAEQPRLRRARGTERMVREWKMEGQAKKNAGGMVIRTHTAAQSVARSQPAGAAWCRWG
jgi:hypothetical protein